MKYTEILRNEHFNNLAAIIRVPFLSEEWKVERPEVPFWSRIENLTEVKTEQMFATNRPEFVKRFVAFLAELTQADPRLAYTEADLAWFIEQMDGENALVVASLLFAWFSAPDEMLTPVEVANATGTHESNWRNKAAAGEIPGAVKKGKQWLLPRSVLRGYGVL